MIDRYNRFRPLIYMEQLNDKMGDNQMNVIIKLKPFLCFLLIPPTTGLLPFLATAKLGVRYREEIQPILCYPLSVFLFIWLLMLTLLGLAGYFIDQSRGRSKQRALRAGASLWMGLILWGLFTLGVNLPLVGFVLMICCSVCAIKFTAETLWVSRAAFFLCGIEFLWTVYLAANSFFLWRL